MTSRLDHIAVSVGNELRSLLERADRTRLGQLADAVQTAGAVFVAGAGRSGLMARAAAMRFMHLGLTVHAVGETTAPAIAPGDLLLVVSGSGGTAGMIMLAEKARALGARIALVTGNPGSSLARLANTVLTVPPPGTENDRPFQPMGNRFEQGALLLLDIVAMEIMARTGETEERMFKRHANLE